MSKRTKLQNFLVGSDYIESRNDFKQAMLRGQLGLFVGVICFLYLLLDPIIGIYEFIYWYLCGLCVSGLVIYLNRTNKGIYSATFLLLFVNTLVFFIADAGSPNRGVFFFFMASAAAGLVLFYLSNLKVGLAFVMLSLLLGVIAHYNENSLLTLAQEDTKSGYFQKLNFTVNFVLGIFSTITILLFIVKRNKESESSLLKSKTKLEKLALELFAKNEELEKINEELDRFVYSASHDMRAPLTTLKGLINIAKLTDNPEEYSMYFKLMINRIKDLEIFINDVTDYSRNTRLIIENEGIELKKLVLELKDAFSFIADSANVNIEIEIAPDLTLYTDLRRIKVILNNLIANAIKYSDFAKEHSFVKVSAQINGKNCVIKVEDNGIGIDSDRQHKIFNMFYRASEKSDGSGLGLYIVNETLKRLKGDIKLTYSSLNIGSEFEVKIPIL